MPKDLIGHSFVMLVLVATLVDEGLQHLRLLTKFHSARFKLVDQVRRQRQWLQFESLVP
jgi:hypothetical protein